MDLLIVVVISLLLVPAVIFMSGALRIALAFIFIFLIVGYTLVAALFPRKTDLSGVERLALSIGLSIAVVSLTGLLLNYLPWGVQLSSLLVALPAFSICMAGIAFYRRSRLHPAERFKLNLRFKPDLLLKSWTGYRTTDKVLTILLAVVVLCTSIAFIYVIAKPNIGQEFTEFYLMGSNGEINEYPKIIYLKEMGHITIGIVNHEYKTVTYGIETTVNGETTDNYGPINLDHLGKWEQKVDFSFTRTGNEQAVEFLLYKGEADTSPQRLRLVIDVYE